MQRSIDCLHYKEHLELHTENQLPCEWMDSQPLTYDFHHKQNLLSIL